MSIGTFDAFTSARLGIYAAQHGLNVTGNNISNINTAGYTRQRIDQVSFKAGAYDRYRSQLDNHVGSGALVMNINQIRDPYLDVRYRNTNADVGYSDRMLAGLQEIADILDEIGLGENPSDNEEGDGLLHAQIQDLADKLRAYQKEPSKANNDLVRTSAETLCWYFNEYADKLERLYQDTVKDFNDQVTEINECLTNIRDLNREIRDCEIYGDNALELRDERNRQIDKLSEYLHIKVVYTEEKIGGAQTVEKLSIYLDDDNPDPAEHKDESMLIDGIFGAQLNRLPKRNPDYDENDPDSLPYVKEDGTFTDDITKAALEDPDNFFLTISKLVDVKNQEWKGVTTGYEEVTDPGVLALLKNVNVGATAGTAPEIWTVKEKAEQAVYGFDFTPAAGTTWEVGDKFKIGDTEYTIGTEVPLATANDPEGMAAFIAGELSRDPRYVDKYDVAPDPNNPTRILFSATVDNAGAIPISDRPKITVSSDPTGKLTFGNRQVITAGKDAVLTPPTVADQVDPATGAETKTSFTQINGKWNRVTTEIQHTKEVDLDDNDIHGSLQATRELLTEKGEFATKDTVADIDENAESKRGIQYYQLSLDLLARQFADQYNKINVGYMQDKDGYYINKDGDQLLLPRNGGEPVNAAGALTDDQKAALIRGGYVLKDAQGNPIEDENGDQIPDLNAWLENTNNGAVKMGGYLFSNRNDRDDPTGITAANISVSHKWSTGEVELVPTYKMLFLEQDGVKVPHSTQSDNALHMVNMIEKSLVYDPTVLVPDAVSNKLFEGSFNGMFDKMNTVCGQDIRANNSSLNTAYSQLVEIDTQRDGVSGVDLNDEAMNMMQYQKAMTAAMRLMTVIDDVLDRLINNTAM